MLGLLLTVVPDAVGQFPVVASTVEHVARTVRLAMASWTGTSSDPTTTGASLAGELDRTLRMLHSSVDRARVMEADLSAASALRCAPAGDSLAGAPWDPGSCDDPFALAAASPPLIEATRILRASVARTFPTRS